MLQAAYVKWKRCTSILILQGMHDILFQCYVSVVIFNGKVSPKVWWKCILLNVGCGAWLSSLFGGIAALDPVKCMSPRGSRGGDDDYLEPLPSPSGRLGAAPLKLKIYVKLPCKKL